MAKLKYIFKRLLISVLVIFLISTFTFWLSRAIPGSPFSRERELLPAVIANLEKKYNMDKPIFQQYTDYIINVFQFDFGPSYFYNETVNDFIAERFPKSMTVGLAAFILAFVLGIPLGIVGALKESRFPDALIKVLTTLFISIPSFVIASLLMYFLGVKLKLLPTAMWGTWRHAVMPVMALAAYPLATITKYMRSSMLEVLDSDYIRTARAKGGSNFVVIYKHALKNAILPILTVSGPMFASVVCGSFVIEQIFNVPGLGKAFTESIMNRDYSMIMGLTVFWAILLIGMVLIVDILYTIVDPRIKLGN